MINDFASQRSECRLISDYRVNRFILYPSHWEEFSDANTFVWNRIKFDAAAAKSVPNNERGVYTFVVESGVGQHPCGHYLLYVGMVDDSDFRTRFLSYLREPSKSKPRQHVLYMIDRWKAHLWFYYSPLPASVPSALVEDKLIKAFLPPVNRDWPAQIRDTMKLVFS